MRTTTNTSTTTERRRGLIAGIVGVMAILAADEAAAQPGPVEGQCSNYRVSPTAATLPAAGGSGTFTIEWDWEEPPFDGMCILNCSYDECGNSVGSVQSSALAWLSATKEHADQVRYTVQAHTGTSERTGTLTVAGATFTVTQQTPCPLSADGVSPSSVTVGAGGGKRTVSVSGRSDCSWPVSDDRDWIEIEVPPGNVSGGGSVTIDVHGHFGAARSGTVTVAGRSVMVSQEAYELPSCPPAGVTPTSLEFGSGAGSATVEVVYPQTEVSCQRQPVSLSEDRDWITTSFDGTTNEVTVSVAANPGAARSGTVTILPALAGEVSVSQAAGAAPCPDKPDGVSPSSVTVEAGRGASVSVSGRSDCSWPVSSDRGWITVDPASVSGGGSVTITVGTNTGGRSGTVTIGGLSVTVTVPCPDKPDGVSPSLVRFGTEGGNASVSVAGPDNCSWPVSSDRDWITVDPASVSGGGSVTITVGTNTGGRSGTVTIGGLSVTVTVPCPDKPDGVSPSLVRFGTEGGNASVSVAGPDNCSWPVSSDRDWITVDPASVSGGGSVTITVGRNTGAEQSGTVTVGGSQGVMVLQEGVPTPCLAAVSPPSVTFGIEGGMRQVSVTGPDDCSWSVESDRGWIGVSSGSVSDGGSVTITVGRNTGAERSGTVTVGSQGVPVSQEGVLPPCPLPGVSSTSLQFGAGGGTGQVSVTGPGDCSWPVSSDRDWITVSPGSVSGGGSVTITAGANPDGARSGTVMIGDRSVSVTQEPPVEEPDREVRLACPRAPDVSSPSVSFDVFDAPVENRQVLVMGPAHCSWSVTDDRSWMSAWPSSLSGGGSIWISVAQNRGGSRTGTVAIGAYDLPVAQRGPHGPTAEAGPDQTARVGAAVVLDGTGSTFLGGLVRYEWTQEREHPQERDRRRWPVEFRSEGKDEPCESPCTDSKPFVLAPAPTADATLVFKLTVTDANGTHLDTVQVTVLGQELTDHRDRLAAKWAARRGYGDDVCTAYDRAPRTAIDVFVWNTHRLHRSGILDYVDDLYAVTGKSPGRTPTNYTGCGGPESNRTFMSMKDPTPGEPSLWAKFHSVYSGDTTVLPAWKKSGDPAGPHRPFFLSLETLGSGPRGQIHFWHPEWLRVRREFTRPLERCGNRVLVIPRTEKCDDCELTDSYDESDVPPCSDGGLPTRYGDYVTDDPYGPYERGHSRERFAITDAYSFEMDQDYNWVTIHDSAPSCNNMKRVYSRRYGDPNWRWKPTDTDCISVHRRFSDNHFLDGATTIKALHLAELRDRIDALRADFGLSAFRWTDPIIVPGVTQAKAEHLTELRAALNAAYSAAGEEDVPEYTDGTIAAGVTPIRAVHWTELQQAVLALEP